MKIYIFDFISFEHFDSFNTCKNSSGLAAIATEPDNTIIAITSEGSYYQAKIDLKKGGDCQIIKQESLNEIIKK